ncbi:hypothetical protein [Achromobacter kerstersii]|uniref:Uncharacterized protein n=1 Tax=Achromobacter kerstersii TaxID=1353890 RepID=A0A6S6Z5C0_9BURK|nr:hypothetical protein [Achromobacter kerstersii]CAB3662693.1 hypothetical protein LMG3441_00644 [Achromobacter kerstersii]
MIPEVETLGKWTITLFLGVIGLCLTTAIRWHWERRSRTSRYKYVAGAHKDMTIGPDPSCLSFALQVDSGHNQHGQVPITVGAVTLMLAKKNGGEMGTSVLGPSRGSDITILPSTKAKFHSVEVNLTKPSLNEAAVLFESGGKTPYFRTGAIDDLTALDMTKRQMELLLHQSVWSIRNLVWDRQTSTANI